MAVRTLYVTRHGAADALGNLLDQGRDQCARLAQRLRGVPFDAIWHSPLPRAADSARILSKAFPAVLVDEAGELIDHVPHVPPAADRTPGDIGFFDGYGEQEAAHGEQLARRLIRRFAHAPGPGRRSTCELLITHAYPVAWLVRDALRAPPRAWLSLRQIANTGLTIIEYADGELPAITCVNDQSHLAGPTPGPPTR